MATIGFRILLHSIFPCFGMQRKPESKKIANERRPLLHDNNISTYQSPTVPNRTDGTYNRTTHTKRPTSTATSRPRILNIKLRSDRTTVSALTLNIELIALLQNTLLGCRELQTYEETVQAQKHGIVEREKEMVLQLRKLSTKIRGIKNSPPNERMIYSLQCAIQVLEEERQSFVQKREYIDRDMALMRDKQFYEQAKIDAILDLALTSVGLLPPQDDNNSEEGIVPRSRRPSQTSFNRPTLANLGLEFFVFGEDQTPLQTIIEQRRLHVQAAQERLSSQKECLKHCRAAWKLEHDRGEDDRSEASFEKDHGQHVQLLKHELEIAYEGYRCLADAEKALGMEEGMIRVPEIRILRSESIVRELAEFYEARMDSHRR